MLRRHATATPLSRTSLVRKLDHCPTARMALHFQSCASRLRHQEHDGAFLAAWT
eukprot:UN04282